MAVIDDRRVSCAPADRLRDYCAARLGRRYARLVGRGTTALYLAFRAIAIRYGVGEVIVPNLICSTALDAILLAGHTPVFADVIPGRWTLDPDDALRRVTPRTRAVLIAHLYGHIATLSRDRYAEGGIVIVEDAVQGLGGAVGQFGDLVVTGFADTKMIGGRGGILLADDPAWAAIIESIGLDRVRIPNGFTLAQDDPHVRAYVPQLLISAPDLITPFDASARNIALIEAGWASLADNVQRRNACAEAWQAAFADLPLTLPERRVGDVVWRYTFAAPSVMLASRIAWGLQQAGVPGTRLYPSLDRWLADPDGGHVPEMLYSTTIAPCLINLWVTPPIVPGNPLMQSAIDIIHAILLRV